MYYAYEELLKKATSLNAKQKDIDALGEWFQQFGQDYWNGEYFDADGKRLFPVYTWDKELDQGDLTGYEFR